MCIAEGPVISHGSTYYVHGKYDMMNEEKHDYCIGWKSPPCDPNENIYNFTSQAWKYTYTTTIDDSPVWGIFHLYGGAGYMAELNINKDISYLILDEMWKNLWIDAYTRAVILEWNTYNANTNLFSVNTLMMEFPEMGGLIPYVRIQTFRLYSLQGIMGYYMLMCQIIFCCFLAYMIYRTIKTAIRCGYREYCSNLDNILELCIIAGSIICIGMYIIRLQLTDFVLRNFRINTKAYVSFGLIANYDEVFSIIIAMVVFCFTLKLLGLLSFNQNIYAVVNVLKVRSFKI